VVKSVAGYDTHRAFVGAEGRMGVIVEVTLRVLPRPERFYRFAIPADAYTSVLSEDPSVLERTADNTLLVELSGYTEDVEESVSRLNRFSQRSLDDDEWSNTIIKLRAQHTKRAADPMATELLHRLQAALDPKGVLRGIE
jgi:hypothetical protein